jgi:hypothetical protein
VGVQSSFADILVLLLFIGSPGPGSIHPLVLAVNGGGLTHSLSLDGYYCAGHAVILTVWRQVWRCCVMNIPLLLWSGDGGRGGGG